MKIQNIVYLYQQGHGCRVVTREDYRYFIGKVIPIFIVRLQSISKLKAIYYLLFKFFSSNNRFITVLANSYNGNFSSPVLEKFMGIFVTGNIFKV